MENHFRQNYFAAGLYSFLSITILANEKPFSPKLFRSGLILLFINYHFGEWKTIFAKIISQRACTPFYQLPFWQMENHFRQNYFAAGLYSFLSITILANGKAFSPKLFCSRLVLLFINYHFGKWKTIFAKIILQQACTPFYQLPFWR